jgi:hypothetical protein
VPFDFVVMCSLIHLVIFSGLGGEGNSDTEIDDAPLRPRPKNASTSGPEVEVDVDGPSAGAKLVYLFSFCCVSTI